MVSKFGNIFRNRENQFAINNLPATDSLMLSKARSREDESKQERNAQQGLEKKTQLCKRMIAIKIAKKTFKCSHTVVWIL